MTSLKELIAQKETLELQIAMARKTEMASAIAQAKAIVAEFNLAVDDVFPQSRARTSAGKERKPVAAKYRDPISGRTWSGRGIAPKWLAGKNREDFAI